MTEHDLQQIIKELCDRLKITVSPEVQKDETVYIVNLIGNDARHFERGRAMTGHALVHIARTVAKQQFGEEPRIILDLNSERRRRLDNIAAMSRKTAELVRVRGGEEELRPMTPAERRAVHVALKDMEGIKTESRGEEPHRRIVVIADWSTE